MKLTSLLFGDFADLFQDGRIDEVESSARMASGSASHSQLQIRRLAQVVEQRIREVERENAMLSVLLVRMLKQLAESQPEETQKMLDEVAAVLKSGAPASSDVLRQMLDLPEQPRPPINDYAKPAMVGTKPPQRPQPAARKKP